MLIEELTDDACDYILSHLKDAISGEPKLTKWEIGFVESVNEQWDRRRWLSDPQKTTLGKIWDKQD